MMRTGWIIAAAAVLPLQPLAAQDVVLTPVRSGYGGTETSAASIKTAIFIERRADFIVRRVTVANDTRDPALRVREIEDTLRAAMVQGQKSGTTLAYGVDVLRPLSPSNLTALSYTGDGRPDTSRTHILVKLPLAAATHLDAASTQIASFLDSVKPVGRTRFRDVEAARIGVSNPNQHRGKLLELIAADTREQAAKFGGATQIEVRNMTAPVQIVPGEGATLYLYLPVDYQIHVK